jgi:putative endonuclease
VVARLQAWFVYIAECADGTLYTGIAVDVAARIAEHDAGRGARYTRGRGPLTVRAVRRCASKGEALRLEHALKRLARAEKEKLANARRLAAWSRRRLGIAARRRPSLSDSAN